MAKGPASKKSNKKKEEEVSSAEQEELREVADELEESSDVGGDSGIEMESGSEEDEENDEVMRTIFIKGLDYDNREADIREQMEKIGPVVRVTVPLTHDNRRNKGFAYIEFQKLADAKKAMELNGTMFLGRKIIVDQAKEKTNFKIHTVFCKNLEFDTTREEIMEHFGSYGPVYNVTLPMDQNSEGRNRGFCFVEYKDENVASKVMKDKHAIRGRQLYLNLGNKTEKRNERRGTDRLYGRRADSREVRSNKTVFDDE